MTSKVSYLRFDRPNVYDMSDEALLEAVGRNDRAALGELFHRYHKDVYRFVVRLSSYSASDLDDMVQNTFIEVARSAARFQGRSAPKTWILGIAANVARMRMRSEKRRFRALTILEGLPFFRAATPLETAQSRQELTRLQQAIVRLPPLLKVAFVMCAVENVPCAEAARSLGIPEGTLWRRLHDARVRIAGDLGKEA